MKNTGQSNTQRWHYQLKSYNLWLKPVNLNHRTTSTRVFSSSRSYTALSVTSFLMAGRLVRAWSADCCLCLVVPGCSCFICPNRRLFSAVGKVFQKQEAAFLWRSVTWLCICATWLYLKLLYLWCKALYYGEFSYIFTCFSLDTYTCMYICTCIVCKCTLS